MTESCFGATCFLQLRLKVRPRIHFKTVTCAGNGLSRGYESLPFKDKCSIQNLKSIVRNNFFYEDYTIIILWIHDFKMTNSNGYSMNFFNVELQSLPLESIKKHYNCW